MKEEDTSNGLSVSSKGFVRQRRTRSNNPMEIDESEDESSMATPASTPNSLQNWREQIVQLQEAIGKRVDVRGTFVHSTTENTCS